ncbi:MAG: hypothetical protein JO006_15635 [Paucibacter sp.]|nr:hypothetical protein [Roseateles sp.]
MSASPAQIERSVARTTGIVGLGLLTALLAPTSSAQSPVDLLNKAGEIIRGTPAQQNNLNQLQQQAAAQAPLPPELAPLFLKRTVTGAELIFTLREIQRLARDRRAALQLASLVGAADSGVAAATSGNFDVMKVLQDQAIQAAFKLAKQVAANAATQALNDHLQALVEDSVDLTAETITLPSPLGLDAKQARRVVTMAALVVGARVSDKMLERAQKDMEGLRKDYQSLIEQREKAATLLFAAIADRNKGGSSEALGDTLNGDDMKFVARDLGKLSVKDFAKDMAAQNLALNYLRRAQPEAFSSYRTQADEVVLRSKAYLRTMTGIAAFGALMANFVQNVGDMAKDKRLVEFVMSMPLIFDFLRAAGPLMTVTVQSATSGIALSTEGSFMSNLFSRKRNFVYALGDKSSEEPSAKDVFAELARSGESAELFKGALFRSDSPGLLQRVGECDRAEAGRMLDATTTKDEREEFANHYFDDPNMGENFSFYTALESPGPSEREQLLAARLLANDYRDRATLDTKPVSKVQQLVSAKYKDWSDAQLMRLIFANKETPARYATLYVGDARIKPMATADALYAYETAAEACKKLLTAIAKPKAVAATTEVAKPAAKVPPAVKSGAKKESK